jgi:hypothetical protein
MTNFKQLNCFPLSYRLCKHLRKDLKLSPKFSIKYNLALGPGVLDLIIS